MLTGYTRQAGLHTDIGDAKKDDRKIFYSSALEKVEIRFMKYSAAS